MSDTVVEVQDEAQALSVDAQQGASTISAQTVGGEPDPAGELMDRIDGVVETLTELGLAMDAENEGICDAASRHLRELVAANIDLTKLLDASTKAQAKMVPAPKSAKAGKCGPLKDGFNLPDLIQLFAADGAEFTIRASDGKKELLSVPGVLVAGEIWGKRPSGMVLQRDFEVVSDKPADVVGFGLFDAGGDQIAWAQLPSVQVMEPQQTYRFTGLCFA